MVENRSAPTVSAVDDYSSLYYRERQKRRELEKELTIALTQLKTFSRELAQNHQNNKAKRVKLANTNDQLVKYATDLRLLLKNLKSTHSELQESYRDTIYRLVLASEFKDNDTGSHITRMSRYSSFLALKLGFKKIEIENIGYAAPMHDVGKIGIPDSIILKNGMLTDREFAVIRTHTTIGAEILENSKARILQIAQTIALSHHEHWNGAGYPSGLKEKSIPIEGRIVALTDAFDALTSKRPYKSPYPIDISCQIILEQREKQFDPEIVDLFINNIDEISRIKDEIDGVSSSDSIDNLRWSERDRRDHSSLVVD